MSHLTLPKTPRPCSRTALAACACAIALSAATACSSASTSSPGAAADGHSAAAASPSPTPLRGSASAGPIQITGAYLPQPASPDVAAVYFTVADTAEQSDVLVSASSTPAAQAMLMRESAVNGAESMTALAGGLPIPARGRVTLAPGGYHLMLTDPAVPLKQGGSVMITLRFRNAGTVTVKVPVTSLLSDALTGPTATAATSSMAAMPGMRGRMRAIT
ncbi:MAG: copper chaperone PCu(A)C [Actinocrinis sp.]